jgi:hypothetical protein
LINRGACDGEGASEVCCGEEEEGSQAVPREEMAVCVVRVRREEETQQTQNHREEKGGERDLAESAGRQHGGWSIALAGFSERSVRLCARTDGRRARARSNSKKQQPEADSRRQ